MESLETSFLTMFQDAHKDSVNKFNAHKSKTLTHCRRIGDRFKVRAFTYIFVKIQLYFSN